MANRKSMYKDMDRHHRTTMAQKKRYYGSTAHSENSMQRWTISEMDKVMAHDIPDSKLAKQIGRSVASIQTMRSRINKDNSLWQNIQEHR